MSFRECTESGGKKRSNWRIGGNERGGLERFEQIQIELTRSKEMTESLERTG